MSFEADLGGFPPAEGMTQGIVMYVRDIHSFASSIQIGKIGCCQDQRSEEQDAILDQNSVRRKNVWIASCILGFHLVLVTTSTGWTQSALGAGNQGQQITSPAVAPLEDFGRRIGPFTIKRQNFTVVLHMKRARVPGARAVASEETVIRMEIRDDAGNIHYAKSFPYKLEGAHFVETTGISVQLLEGRQERGLLITYGEDPSTPLGGASYQVFGMFNGKLVPFSKPIAMEGNLIQPEPNSENVVTTSTEPDLQAEVVRFRVWTGNVFVIIPVRVDWMLAKVRPAWQCYRMTAHGMRPQCQFKVEADRRPSENELSFVRLLSGPEEETGIAEHVVVKKDSRVEILEASGEQVWEETNKRIVLGVGEDLWLKVRLDGKEGWIHTQEDFNAIGLPQAG